MADGTDFARCGTCDQWDDSVCRCPASRFYKKKRIEGATRCEQHPAMRKKTGWLNTGNADRTAAG